MLISQPLKDLNGNPVHDYIPSTVFHAYQIVARETHEPVLFANNFNVYRTVTRDKISSISFCQTYTIMEDSTYSLDTVRLVNRLGASKVPFIEEYARLRNVMARETPDEDPDTYMYTYKQVEKMEPREILRVLDDMYMLAKKDETRVWIIDMVQNFLQTSTAVKDTDIIVKLTLKLDDYQRESIEDVVDSILSRAPFTPVDYNVLDVIVKV